MLNWVIFGQFIQMSNLANGFQLMLIGMVTVFVILTIVIYGSKLLIQVINKVSPEETSTSHGKKTEEGTHHAVLEAAVSQITGGTGHIVRITEL